LLRELGVQSGRQKKSHLSFTLHHAPYARWRCSSPVASCMERDRQGFDLLVHTVNGAA